MVSKSDVNRFKILPVGTVSKNFIGPFMMLVSRFVWIAFDALTHLKKIRKMEKLLKMYLQVIIPEETN